MYEYEAVAAPAAAGTLALSGHAAVTGARSGLDDSILREELRYLTRVAYLLCGNPTRAEDAAAETVARIWHRAQRVPIERLRPYARQTLISVLSRAGERYRGERAALDRTGPPAPLGGHDDAIAGRADMTRALQQLPAGQRAVIVLRYFADLSEQEIAQTLQISTGTVKSRASRGLIALREMLEGGTGNA